MKGICTNNWLGRSLASIALLMLCSGFSTLALAARDGELGLESTGSILISLKIEQGVQITDLEDWDLSVSRDNTGSDYEFVKDFCVRGTVGSRIAVTAWTNNIVGNRFALISEDNELLAFQLEFNPEIATGQYRVLCETAHRQNGL